jgi:aminoglycoside phosphotransferase (APT) family kinase protein
MEGNIFRDYRMVTALWDSAVPVPRPVTSCADPSKLGFPFTMVEYVPGVTVRTESDLLNLGLPEAISQCVDSLLRVLGDLHAIRPATLGLVEAELPPDHLAGQIHWWRDRWDQCGLPDGSCSRDMERLQHGLVETAPRPAGTSLIHGQFRIDNAILAGAEVSVVRAVVDWKGAAISDPIADVALMCAYRDQVADGIYGNPHAAWRHRLMVSGDEIADRYTQISGRQLVHWSFHRSLAYFKLATLAAVCEQYRDGNPSQRTYETVGALVATGLATLGSQD